jgi:hypothetical protein
MRAARIVNVNVPLQMLEDGKIVARGVLNP